MENDDKTQLPPTQPTSEQAKAPAESEVSDTALEGLSGGLRSKGFPTGAPLPPVKERKSGILTPLSDG